MENEDRKRRRKIRGIEADVGKGEAEEVRRRVTEI